MRRFVIGDQQGARDGIVGEVLFAIERLHGEFNALCARGPGGKEEWFSLEASVGAQGDLVFFQNFVAVANHEGGLFARVAMLREGHGGGYTRVCESLFRDTYILDLDIVRELFATESDGVHGKTTIAQGLESVGTDSRAAEAGRVLSAIAKKDDRTDWKIGGVRDQLPESIIDAGGGSRGRDALCAVDALDVSVEAIKTRLETILESGEHSAVEGCQCGVFAGTAVHISRGHAARIVHDDGNDVLLRTEFPHRHCRLPQEEQQQRQRSTTA